MPAYRNIPTMFQKRLLLLAAACAMVLGGLTVQLLRLSVAEGSERRAAAEAKLSRRTFLATYRGPILDRNGVPLAVDRASYDVAVAYELVTGEWQIDAAADAARKRTGRAAWQAMSPAARDAAIQEALPAFEARAEEVWGTIELHGGLTRADLRERRDAIMAEVQSLAAAVWDRHRTTWEAEQRARLSRRSLIAEEPEPFTPQPIREQTVAHVILPRVSDDTAHVFQRLAQRCPGLVEVRDSTRREHPALVREVVLDRASLPRPIRSDQPLRLTVVGVADHVIGSMREGIWAGDGRPFRDPATGAIDLKGYRSGDARGARGLEHAFEDHLRGTRGMIVEHRGTGARQRIAPIPGGELRLTLDIDLQARVQAILAPELGLTVVQPWHQNHVLPPGRPLNSAAVVLEIESGEVLALVSMPTLALAERLSEPERKRDAPWINRPAEAVYPPGSIIKPMILAAAVESGRHQLQDAVRCSGHYFPEVATQFRCWLYRDQYGMETHGELRASEALARSCNIYFYTIADRVGLRDLTTWLGRFGLGERCGSGLGYSAEVRAEGPGGAAASRTIWMGEAAGELPGPEAIADMERQGTLRSATISVGIGQGPVTWTPLQAAAAYAILARRGAVIPPTLLLDDPRGSPPAPRGDARLGATLVEEILEGLRQSVAERHGTGFRLPYDDGDSEPIFNAPGVTVWGKTGTAQAPPLPHDADGDGDLDDDPPIANLDHAWFVGLVGPEGGGPQYAIAVVVEYAGSGGRVSGPVANQIIRALQQAGYLTAGERA